MSGIVNVIALGSSFLSGAFVPQEFLSSEVLAFSKIFPSYWFITNNNLIASTTNFNTESLKAIFSNMFILSLFIVIFMMIHRLIIKYKLNRGI